MQSVNVPFTVNVIGEGPQQVFQITVPSAKKYVLEVTGAESLVGVWDGPQPIPRVNGVLRVCGSSSKGVHTFSAAGVKSITVDAKQSGSLTLNLRNWVFSDYFWAWTGGYKSTC